MNRRQVFSLFGVAGVMAVVGESKASTEIISDEIEKPFYMDGDHLERHTTWTRNPRPHNWRVISETARIGNDGLEYVTTVAIR